MGINEPTYNGLQLTAYTWKKYEATGGDESPTGFIGGVVLRIVDAGWRSMCFTLSDLDFIIHVVVNMIDVLFIEEAKLVRLYHSS